MTDQKFDDAVDVESMTPNASAESPGHLEKKAAVSKGVHKRHGGD